MKVLEYLSYGMLPGLMFLILFYGMRKKVPPYDTFVEGAKDGFQVILRIFPTMIAMMVAIQLFKVSGAMELLIQLFQPLIATLKIPGEVLPLGIMRSISGGGAIAILSDTLNEYGPDSFVGKVASTIMGSSDTTLYVLALYTGVIGIKKTKGALAIGLCCDVIAFLIAVWIWNLLL